jgi:fructosamine-3-kinase
MIVVFLLVYYMVISAQAFRLSITSMNSKDLLEKISTEISIKTGTSFRAMNEGYSTGSGGSGASTRVIMDEKSKLEYFIKVSGLSGFEMLRCEYEGIKEIYETKTIRVPKPICYGTADYNSFVVFEKLSLGGHADPSIAGVKLAEMHKKLSPNHKFGWDFNNTIGEILVLQYL